jgi:hypothetical protein
LRANWCVFGIVAAGTLAVADCGRRLRRLYS